MFLLFFECFWTVLVVLGPKGKTLIIGIHILIGFDPQIINVHQQFTLNFESFKRLFLPQQTTAPWTPFFVKNWVLYVSSCMQILSSNGQYPAEL